MLFVVGAPVRAGMTAVSLQSGPSESLSESPAGMAAGAGRVSCGREVSCVPEVGDTLSAVAKLG